MGSGILVFKVGKLLFHLQFMYIHLQPLTHDLVRGLCLADVDRLLNMSYSELFGLVNFEVLLPNTFGPITVNQAKAIYLFLILIFLKY